MTVGFVFGPDVEVEVEQSATLLSLPPQMPQPTTPTCIQPLDQPLKFGIPPLGITLTSEQVTPADASHAMMGPTYL